MSRRRRHVSSRDGLWDWTDTNDVQPAEVRPNPLLVVCRVPTCGAVIGESCTIPRRRGRIRRSPHPPRIEDAIRAAAADQNAAVLPADQAQDGRKDRA